MRLVGLLLILNTFTLSYANVASKIFIGEAFSSRNGYLIGFHTSVRWPEKLRFYAINESQPLSTAMFLKNIPACSNKSNFLVKEKKLLGVDYIIDAFFNTVLDECVDEEVGLYQLKRPPKSHLRVIASTLKLTRFSLKNQGTLRKLQDNERQQIQKYKKEVAKTSQTYECSTEAKFLDEAQVIVDFDIVRGGYHAQLSHYFNPGCAGHLNNIYILDLYQKGSFIKSYQTFHYEGAI